MLVAVAKTIKIIWEVLEFPLSFLLFSISIVFDLALLLSL